MKNLLTLVQKELVTRIMADITLLESKDQFSYANVLIILHKYRAEIEKTDEQIMIDDSNHE